MTIRARLVRRSGSKATHLPRISGVSAAEIEKQDALANTKIAITHGELLRKTGGAPLKGGKCDLAVTEYNDARLNLSGPIHR